MNEIIFPSSSIKVFFFLSLFFSVNVPIVIAASDVMEEMWTRHSWHFVCQEFSSYVRRVRRKK
jgi:hypothetical protein